MTYITARICLACAVLLGTLVATYGQYSIIGFVYDTHEEPFIANEVRLQAKDFRLTTQTDLEGRFEFHDVPAGKYHIVVITDYGIIDRDINLRTSLEVHLQRSRTIRTDEVVVRAVREEGPTPVVRSQLDREDIEVRNLGQDVPFVLKWTPSLVTTSDAGTGIGYTGLRIRGTDPTRINVTINGVPLNDAESQGVFWVDLPDLMSSTESIQIQRGVGSSTFGTGAFGASINLNTTNTETDPYVRLRASGGSFGTIRGNVGFGTGLLNKHFTIDGRVSTIQSDGFIDRASADLRSYFGSVAYVSARTSLRFTSFGGKEVTYQAWNGVPAQYIDDEDLRTFNTAGTEKEGAPYDNEVDDYTQLHYQLQFNQNVFAQLQAHATLFYTRGKGFFEQYKNPLFFEDNFADFLADYNLADGDAIRRRWLDNHYYGFITGFHFTDPSDKYDIRLNGGWNRYLGDHFGDVIWSELAESTDELPYYYFNDAVKTSGNVFLKVNRKLGDRFGLFTDLQYRRVNYTFEGLSNEGEPLEQTVNLGFFNPKVGVNAALSENISLSYFFGIANREPNRDDYISSPQDALPKPERLYDNELQFVYQTDKARLSAIAYYMIYRDQLVITGRLNDVGEYTRVNVDNSYRLGLEIDWAYAITERLTFGGAATFSRNRVRSYTEYVDNWDTGEQVAIIRENTPLALSPDIILYGTLEYAFVRKEKHEAMAGISTKYVGNQYVDNSGTAESAFDPYSFTDFQLTYNFNWRSDRQVGFNLIVRNIFNQQYETNAWNYRFLSPSYDPTPDDPYAVSEGEGFYHLRGFFPQAGINILAGLTVTF